MFISSLSLSWRLSHLFKKFCSTFYYIWLLMTLWYLLKLQFFIFFSRRRRKSLIKCSSLASAILTWRICYPCRSWCRSKIKWAFIIKQTIFNILMKRWLQEEIAFLQFVIDLSHIKWINSSNKFYLFNTLKNLLFKIFFFAIKVCFLDFSYHIFTSWGIAWWACVHAWCTSNIS